MSEVKGALKKEGEPKSKLKVLIVEDDPDVLSLIKTITDVVGGFKAITIDNVTDALRILKESKNENQSIDIVFSDLKLGDDVDGGLKIAGEIKAEKLAKYFILFTGSADRFEGMSGEERADRGINLIIPKPAEFKILKASFDNAKKIISSKQASR
jgi:response regulator RpfG family c-di-GMP phosphodiesterase